MIKQYCDVCEKEVEPNVYIQQCDLCKDCEKKVKAFIEKLKGEQEPEEPKKYGRSYR